MRSLAGRQHTPAGKIGIKKSQDGTFPSGHFTEQYSPCAGGGFFKTIFFANANTATAEYWRDARGSAEVFKGARTKFAGKIGIKKSQDGGSNPGPIAYEAIALPAELSWQ